MFITLTIQSLIQSIDSGEFGKQNRKQFRHYQGRFPCCHTFQELKVQYVHVILTVHLGSLVLMWEVLSSFYKQQKRVASRVDRVLKSGRYL